MTTDSTTGILCLMHKLADMVDPRSENVLAKKIMIMTDFAKENGYSIVFSENENMQNVIGPHWAMYGASNHRITGLFKTIGELAEHVIEHNVELRAE